MKGILPGVLSLLLTGYVYTQSYNIAGGTLKSMQAMMEGAATQMNVADQPANTSSNELF